MGSSGAGAGGGGGGGGGGGFGGGMDSVVLRGGALTSADPGAVAAFEAIVEVYAKVSRDYLSSLLSDPGVAKAYEALFRLGVALLQDRRSWDAVQREFGVDDGPGCLARLAAALASDSGNDAVSPALQAPLQAALLDFLLRAVGDDLAIRNRGDAAEVLAAASSDVFERTANLFLGSYLSEILRLEGKNLNRPARAHLNDFAMAQADRIVDAFARKFRHQPWKDIPQVSYPNMIRVLGGEQDWTVKQLRAKVTP